MLAINLHPFPVIKTARLTLRDLTFDDAEALLKMRTDPEVLKYVDITPPASLVYVQDWIKIIHHNHEKNEGILWAINLNGCNELIGTICFWQIDKPNHRAEIGYMLTPGFQGKGIMQEALYEAIKFAFEDIGLHSIEASVNPLNEASIKLLERNGFVREGYLKEIYYRNGQFIDSAIYSLVATKK